MRYLWTKGLVINNNNIKHLQLFIFTFSAIRSTFLRYLIDRKSRAFFPPGARFDVLQVDLGMSVLVEYDPSHIFTFDLSANTAVSTTTIENRNNAEGRAISDVWQVSLLGDVRMCLQQPGSEFYLETMATLTAEQTMSPFFGGATFEILGIRADLNLSSFYCPDEEYHLCVTLGKNPNSVPAFTLENGVSDPTQCQTSVLTVCQLVTCVGRSNSFNFSGKV